MNARRSIVIPTGGKLLSGAGYRDVAVTMPALPWAEDAFDAARAETAPILPTIKRPEQRSTPRPLHERFIDALRRASMEERQ